ncbi:MAG: peptidoglycan-associated lipoprotein Pal, partial [Nitrospira sp. SB0666_bin_27]|nr:peptidoglycan-associated lipoprotein Pal [Nitrospira sp. SB0666_bin_27]
VFFDFDEYAIRPDARPILEKDAELLKKTYKDSGVLIEGHCDERGTVEYNLELGKRRAQAVKDYLVDLGIEESRIRIVSYGKERPFCTESEPSCWKQNRRGHFVRQ